MIQTEKPTEFPEFEWNTTSMFEHGATGEASRRELFERSTIVRVLLRDEVPLCVAGLYYTNFLSVPYLWVLLTKDFDSKPSNLRGLIRALLAYAPRCETLIEEANAPAMRLAQTFGFQPTTQVVTHNDQPYRLHRRG